MMRPLYAIGMLLTGCATDPTFEPSSADQGTAPGGAAVGTAPELTPRVCAAHVWTTIAAKANQAQLAVATVPGGAAIFVIPHGGGALSGFAIDSEGQQLGSPAGTQLAAGPFASVRAAYVDSRLVAAASDGTNTHVDVVRDDFSDTVEIGKLPGTFVGEQPVSETRSVRTAASAGSNGVFLSTFDAQWVPTGSTFVIESPVTGFTSQPFGGEDTMVAWSTTDSCYVDRVATGGLSARPTPCADPHLATDVASNSGKLVFERAGDVYAGDIFTAKQNAMADAATIATHASSPRVVFDGARYWISFLDERGDVVVGRVDGEGRLWSMAIEGMRPGTDSYQLAIVGGRPWVFAVNAFAFTAAEMCAP